MKKFLLMGIAAVMSMAASAATVTGSVYIPSGAPVVGAQVLFLSENSFFGATDENGTFTLTDVLPGDYYLVIRADGYPEYENPSVPVGDEDVSLGVIILKSPTYTLNGRVYGDFDGTGENNMELMGAEVSVKYELDGETVVLGPQATVEDGSFLFADLPLNTSYEVTASRDAFVTKTVTFTEEDAANDLFLNIVLVKDNEMKTVSVTGVVVNTDDEPVANSIITIDLVKEDGTLGDGWIVNSVDDGSFEATGLYANNTYRATFVTAGYKDYVLEKFETAEENVDFGKIVLEKIEDSLESIESESNEAPVYYNLQGCRVANPQGICVKVVGNKATKVYVK